MKTKVVCWFEVCSDGSTQWEMVDPAKSECIEYFRTKEEARAYADSHGLEIVEWQLD